VESWVLSPRQKSASRLLKPIWPNLKDRGIKEMKMTTAIYLKSSYLRENALGKMQHIPINIGIAVKGLEYQ